MLNLVRAAAAVAALTVALPAAAQETIRLTVAAGHPPIFLWVKHIRETFMPTVDAELAKTGKYKIAWNEAYGGTLAKIGSELETMQQGISDMGIVATVFQSAKLPLNNVTYFVPFGPPDANVVTKAIDYVQALPELTAEWSKFGVVYLAGFSIDNYGFATNFPIARWRGGGAGQPQHLLQRHQDRRVRRGGRVRHLGRAGEVVRGRAAFHGDQLRRDVRRRRRDQQGPLGPDA
jgi:TRAP-type C4-dicarboxylate transport system substrate-binding protein